MADKFTRNYYPEYRENWTSGIWDTEPDEIIWIDPTTQLNCIMRRNSAGAWCGYVLVPLNHLAYDLKGISRLNVHGGVNYSKSREYCGSTFWWYGFDCDHYSDLSPSSKNYWASINSNYCDQENVINKVTDLARQIAEFTKA